jgi:hypothetical protein
MANVRQDNVQVNVEINGQRAGKTLSDLKKESQQLYRELNKLVPGSKEFVDKLAEVKKVEKQLGDVRKAIKGIDEEMKNSSGGFMAKLKSVQGSVKSAVDSLGPLGGMIATVFSIGVIVNFIKSVFEVTAAFQKYEAVLTNTLGSQYLAKMAMEEIKDIASKTPFSVDELTSAYVKLRNQGINPTRADIVRMGDLAASVGKSFDQLTEAVIDGISGEMERLKEFGIKAQKEGDKIKFTFKGQTTEIKNTSEEIQKYIIGLGDLEGVTGGMAAISETLGGKLSNLGDSFDSLFNTIGSGTGGIMGKAIELLNEYIQWIEVALRNTKQIQDAAVSELTKKFADEFAKADSVNKDRLIRFTRERLDALNQMLEAQRNYNRETGLFDGEKFTEKELEEIRLDIAIYQSRMDWLVAYGKEKNELLRKQHQETLGLIETLEKKIKELKESQQKAMSPADIRRIGEEIKQTQEELDELLGKNDEKRRQARLAAEKDIADRTIALMKDEFLKKQELLYQQAERDKKTVSESLATAEQKARQIVLIEEKLIAELDTLLDDFNKKRAKKEEERLKKEQELRNRAALARADLEVLAAGKNDAQLLEASIRRLDVQQEVELQNTELIEEEKWLITAKYEAEKDALREAYAAKEWDRQKQMLQSSRKLIEGGLDAMQDYNNLHFEKEVQAAESAKNQKMAILKGELNEKVLNEEQYNDAKAAAEEKYQQQARRIKRQQAAADKQAKLVEAMVATFAAVAKALPNIPLSVLAGATGALQIAKISATKLPEFSHGGAFTVNGGIPAGASHGEGGIAMIDTLSGRKVGEMEGGEPYMILSKNTMANNGDVIHKLLDSSMYRNGAKIYADGGVFGGQVPAGNTSDGNALFMQMLIQLQNIEGAIRGFNTRLRAIVVLNDLKEAEQLDSEIEQNSGFGS